MRVLEIGVGSGLNLAFYGRGVTQLNALEPSAALIRMGGSRHKEDLSMEFVERSVRPLRQ